METVSFRLDRRAGGAGDDRAGRRWVDRMDGWRRVGLVDALMPDLSKRDIRELNVETKWWCKRMFR